MPFKLTHVKFSHSTTFDASAQIRRSGLIQGTCSDKNPVCGSVGLHKVWCCATKVGDGMRDCCTHGDTQFTVGAQEILSSVWNGEWLAYRTKNFNGYRVVYDRSQHVFYNFFLVPQCKALSPVQANMLVRADLWDDDPVQLFWNRGNPYILERYEDGDDSTITTTDEEEVRHFHVAIVADMIGLSGVSFRHEGETDTTTTTEETSTSEDVPQEYGEDTTTTIAQIPFNAVDITNTTTTACLDVDDVSTETETREEQDEYGLTVESNIGWTDLGEECVAMPSLGAQHVVMGRAAGDFPKWLRSWLKEEVLESVGTSNTMLRAENCGKRGQDRDKFARALEKVLAHAGGATTRLTLTDLSEWHEILMSGAARAGEFRTNTIARCGARTFTRPGQVMSALLAFWSQLDRMGLFQTRSRYWDPAVYGKAAYVCYHFVRIHPFSDGNGRMARLLLLWTLRRCGFPLLVAVCAPGHGRQRFVEAMRHADQNGGCLDELTRLIAEK